MPFEDRSTRGFRPIDADDDVRRVELRDLVRLLVRSAPFAILVTVAAVATAVWITRTTDPTYEASVAMVVAQSAPRVDAIDVAVPSVVDANVYRTAIYEGDVLRSALERIEGRPLGDTELRAFAESVRVAIEAQQLSSVLRIEVRDRSPERAARIANAVAEALTDWDRERSGERLAQAIAGLERSIASIDAELASLGGEASERAAELQALRAQRVAELGRAREATATSVSVGLVQRMSLARPPEAPVGPRMVLNVGIALLLGLVGAYGLAAAFWASNPRVEDRRDLERVSGRPVLAETARPRRGDRRLPDEDVAWLRARLTRRLGAGQHVLLVTGLASASDKEGVSVGLAESFARSGRRTLLVDADLRSAGVTTWLDAGGGRATPYDTGVDVLRATEPVAVVVDRDRAFDVIAARAGSDHPAERVLRAFEANIQSWRDAYDVVLVDAAPILVGPDALAAVPFASAVLVCVGASHATRGQVAEALSLVEEQGVPVVGTVLTGARRPAERKPQVGLRSAAPGGGSARRAPASRRG